MTLDEAIRYALEVAETNDCEECRAEHLQLAEWLQELRAIRQEVKKLRETLHFLKADHELACYQITTRGTAPDQPLFQPAQGNSMPTT